MVYIDVVCPTPPILLLLEVFIQTMVQPDQHYEHRQRKEAHTRLLPARVFLLLVLVS